MSTVHQYADGSIIQYTKGAPDEVLKRCTTVISGGKQLPMTDALRMQILEQNKEMADQALRVLCAACRAWDAAPPSYDASFLEQDLCYIGLTGMIDPVRPCLLYTSRCV